MKLLGMMTFLVVGLPVMLLLAGQLGLLAGKTPKNLGLHGGRLLPPSKTSNSVSSQADLYPDHPQRVDASIAPFKYTGEGKAALQRLAQLLQRSQGTVLVRQESGYLYAQCHTALLKFTDDLEFALDESARVIHVRSASRLGQKDFGANRQRVQSLRAQFEP